MTRQKNLLAVAATCLMTTTFFVPAGAAEDVKISSATEGWTAFTKCAAISDDKSRHACFDDLSHAAGLLPAAETSHRKSFGLQSVAPRAADPGTKAKDEQLEVTLATIVKGGDGKLTLTTTDGAVWRQADSDTIRDLPEQGQKMTIEKASLGSFLCRPSKWLAFHCQRVR